MPHSWRMIVAGASVVHEPLPRHRSSRTPEKDGHASHPSPRHGSLWLHLPSPSGSAHVGIPGVTSMKSQVAANVGATPREVEMIPTAKPVDALVNQFAGTNTERPTVSRPLVTPFVVTV